jgi:DNA processing protein
LAQSPDDERQGGLFTPPPLPVAPLDDDQRLACLRLIRSDNVGPATFRALINHFGGATRALAALPDLARKAARGRAIRVCPAADAEAELDAAARIGAVPLFNIEPHFPAALAFVEGAPPMIYAKGRLDLLNTPGVAFVGSRDASAAGQKMARLLAADVGRAGYVVISGLARGIDSAAHRASLATGTIAVLAGGLDNIYPPENADLQAAIGNDGCLVAEQPAGYQPRGPDFPRRNRIISGIARAVVVIEAARKSGSLITARLALEQGRDVFAVPGHPLDPRAEGTNRLIKSGAVVVTEAADVLQALGEQNRAYFEDRAVESMGFIRAPPTGSRDASATDTERVLAALGPAPVEVDEIARATGLQIHIVRIVLIELMLAGRIEQHGAQLVSLRS